jgi:hypothetical protein
MWKTGWQRKPKSDRRRRHNRDAACSGQRRSATRYLREFLFLVKLSQRVCSTSHAARHHTKNDERLARIDEAESNQSFAQARRQGTIGVRLRNVKRARVT